LFNTLYKMPFYAVRVTSGKEEIVAELLATEVNKQMLEVYSVSVLPGLKGYIIVEAKDSLEVQRAIFGLRYAKSVIPEELNIDDILKHFEETKKLEEFGRGDIVEILIGAFKGTRAKIIKIDSKKGELTVELLDTPVPLNITIPITGVKLIKKSTE